MYVCMHVCMHVCMCKCQDRGAWIRLIKPTAGKKTKAEARYQARKASTEQPEGLGQVSAGKRGADELTATTIEHLTRRRRMTAEERDALQISCDRCGQKFSRPQDLKRHSGTCGTAKRRMTAQDRASQPFECDKCGCRFSRQQDIARHKCPMTSSTSSSGANQTKQIEKFDTDN